MNAMNLSQVLPRLMFVLIAATAGCASWITGGKPVVPHGLQQINVIYGYGTVDKICIATSNLAPTSRVSKDTLTRALKDAASARAAADTVLMASQAQARPAGLSTSDIINDATVILATTLQMAQADKVFGGIVLAMQADGRNFLTDSEKVTVNSQLDRDCSAAQSAVDKMENGG